MQDVGSQISSVGSLIVQGQNIKVKGSGLNSEQGTTQLSAVDQLDIIEGRKTSQFDNQIYNSHKGLLSSKTTSGLTHNRSDEAIASTVEGNKVILDANNINIRGSNIVSDALTQIQAKENVSITGAENTYLNETEQSTQKSGLMSSGGIGFSVGQKNERTAQQNTQLTNTGSMVGSLNGNTNIVAGKTYQQTGSTVSSQKGDVNILAQQVNIEAAKEQSTSDYKHEMQQKGLTLAVNVPVVSNVQSVVESAKQVGQSKNDRVNAMAAANAGFDAYKAGQSLGKLQGALSNAGSLNGGVEVGVSLTYGEQKNTETSHSQSTTASQSQVNAGGTTTIVATGAGDQSNINIIGSDVLGQQGTRLVADNNVNIKAAEQNHIEESKNESAGWNAGVTVSNQTGFGVTAGGNLGKGKGNGTDTSYVNSHVGSKDSLTTITSGKTTNIIGGQVQGKGVQIEVDNLNVESLQDKATYKSKQQNMSAQVSVGFSGGNVSGSFSKSNVDANYASVNEQSGVFAGDDGYQIKVNKNTDLKGAMITSTQTAENLKKNSLDTGTLTSSNIQNVTEYDAKGISVGGGFNAGKSGTAGNKEPGTVLSTPNKVDQHASTTVGVSKSVGFGLDSDKDSSVTKSGVNTQNITIRDEQGQQALTGKTAGQIKSEILTSVTTDTARENSGALQNNFDKDKVQSEINLQMDVTKNFDANRQEAKAEINKKIDDAKKENQSIIDKQKQGLDLSKQEQDQLKAYNNKVENYQRLGVLLDSISTGLSAPTSSGLGIATATLSPAASYKIGQYFKEQASNNVNGQLTSGQEAAHILAHTVLGAAVAAAGGNDALNAGLSAGGAEAAAPVLSSFLYGKAAKDLTADQKSTISSIVGLAGSAVGATTGDIGSTVQSGQVAQNAVENNYLTYKEALTKEQAKTKLANCNRTNKCSPDEIRQVELTLKLLESKDQITDAKILETCRTNPQSSACQQQKKDLQATIASYAFKDSPAQYQAALNAERNQDLGLLKNLPQSSIVPVDYIKGNGFIYELAPTFLTGLQLTSGGSISSLGKYSGEIIGAIGGAAAGYVSGGDAQSVGIGAAVGVVGGRVNEKVVGKIDRKLTTAGYDPLGVGMAKGATTMGMGGASGISGTVITNKVKGDPWYTDVPKSAVVGALVPAISGEAAVAAAGASGKIQTVVSLNSAVVGVAAEKIQQVKPKKTNPNNKEGGK
jgi:filamentous hemagglutinin